GLTFVNSHEFQDTIADCERIPIDRKGESADALPARLPMNFLENLKTFVAIADAGSLIGGARRRRISAPTATRALAGWEKDLGVRLSVRPTRALRLTDAGDDSLVQARRVVSAVEDAAATVTGRRVRPEGRLSVTAPELFGERYIAPLLFEFLDANPL